jgi:hypothetical protein
LRWYREEHMDLRDGGAVTLEPFRAVFKNLAGSLSN